MRDHVNARPLPLEHIVREHRIVGASLRLFCLHHSRMSQEIHQLISEPLRGMPRLRQTLERIIGPPHCRGLVAKHSMDSASPEIQPLQFLPARVAHDGRIQLLREHLQTVRGAHRATGR